MASIPFLELSSYWHLLSFSCLFLLDESKINIILNLLEKKNLKFLLNLFLLELLLLEL